MDTLKIILLIVILVLLCFFLMKKIEYFQATPTCKNLTTQVTDGDGKTDILFKTYCLYEDTAKKVVSAEFNYVTKIWPININDMSVVSSNEFHNNKPEDKGDFQIMNFYELNGLDNESNGKIPSKLTIYNNDNKNSSHYTVGFYFNIKSSSLRSDYIQFFNLYDDDDNDGTPNPVITMFFKKHTQKATEHIIIKIGNTYINPITIKYDVYNYVIIHIEQNKPPLIFINDNINKNTKQNIDKDFSAKAVLKATSSVTDKTAAVKLAAEKAATAKAAYDKAVQTAKSADTKAVDADKAVNDATEEGIIPGLVSAAKKEADALSAVYKNNYEEAAKNLAIAKQAVDDANQVLVKAQAAALAAKTGDSQNIYSIPPDFNLNKLVFQSSDGEVADNKLISNINILVGRMLIRGIIVPIEELVREYSDNIDVPY